MRGGPPHRERDFFSYGRGREEAAHPLFWGESPPTRRGCSPGGAPIPPQRRRRTPPGAPKNFRGEKCFSPPKKPFPRRGKNFSASAAKIDPRENTFRSQSRAPGWVEGENPVLFPRGGKKKSRPSQWGDNRPIFSPPGARALPKPCFPYPQKTKWWARRAEPPRPKNGRLPSGIPNQPALVPNQRPRGKPLAAQNSEDALYAPVWSSTSTRIPPGSPVIGRDPLPDGRVPVLKQKGSMIVAISRTTRRSSPTYTKSKYAPSALLKQAMCFEKLQGQRDRQNRL